MARNRGLTEEGISSLPPAAAGMRYDVADLQTPNLFIRVGTKKKVFVYVARFAGGKSPTRKTIGVFPAMSLEEARATALQWSREVQRGLDPKEERKIAERERLMLRRRTFRSVMEDYIVDLPTRKRNRHVANDIMTIRHNMLDPAGNSWLEKPIADVTDADIAKLLEDIRDRPARAQAFNCLALLKGFFHWTMFPARRGEYGVTANPVANITPADLKLWKNKRKVLPTVYQLRAYMMAARATPYPYGPFFEAVIFTGAVRKAELARSRWSEFDLHMALWTVPASRVKNGEEQPEHLVPLTYTMISLLDRLRRNQPAGHGYYVFSTTYGQKPINGFGKAMKAFRGRIDDALREIAPAAGSQHIILHDTRRLVRSALSALDVPDVVAELIIGHGRKGIEGVYDQYKYLPQMRNALDRFTERLHFILDGTVDHFGDDPNVPKSWHGAPGDGVP
ncbi:putative Site-specific recombinase, phage integrase family [Pseudorhizobium banfieldiae]|uniref:Putative Site-specific recombinase, phage integrase family n=1 Tax=Pseudorhizobium banfieldiae TaxID=1125847 RepID=L0NFS6_9HYPH|nr:integrase arm-type DNA-binding domain-containing protein [Pseudorhizobium banfieldiae]CAD6613619.1 hypothetical protein RNT25_02588 [arsenite-oxidising bacterium NT-25]CCF19958.1 putative Site-specific recombinase, phage integrase family [Pseudorhizobium banfieldiae]